MSFGKEFGKKFSTGITSSINYEWSQTSSTTWDAEISNTVVVNVSPEKTVNLYQIFGYYGQYIIKANEFIVKEENRDGTEYKGYKVKGKAKEQ